MRLEDKANVVGGGDDMNESDPTSDDGDVWFSSSQAYTGFNHGDQPQPESGVVRGNDIHEEPPVVINNGSNDRNNGNRNDILLDDGYSNIGGAVAEPTTGDPRYKQWKLKNSLIIAWLVSSMETGIGKSYMFLPSAKDVREALKETYSDIQNSSQISDLKSKLWHAKQGVHKIVFCFSRGKKIIVYSLFLAGLNKDLDELKGKPPIWKKKNGRAFQASNSDQGKQPPPSQFPLTTEQLDRLYKLFESPTHSCSIATKGNSAFLSVSPSHTWIVDSGASDHMAGESTLFSSYSPCDLKSGKMIGSAKESGGLYYLDIGSASQLP
ncbi:hypothetical protein KIW84_034656 [Lathyrus oleraceus]|uniref:Uncharacterized protein n=1 Tax=Pisum sativum TaxID=3888 RepID=A0A9D4Y1R7_PEA|nr:hypothetical protein KIW84_034656 [Pisum sativum]